MSLMLSNGKAPQTTLGFGDANMELSLGKGWDAGNHRIKVELTTIFAIIDHKGKDAETISGSVRFRNHLTGFDTNHVDAADVRKSGNGFAQKKETLILEVDKYDPKTAVRLLRFEPSLTWGLDCKVAFTIGGIIKVIEHTLPDGTVLKY